MSDSSIKVSNNAAGDRPVDNESVAGHPDGTAYRQRIEVTGAALAEIARVTNSVPGGSEYALAVRQVGAHAVSDGGSSLTVDGSVTADQGAAAAVASAWPVKITNGTDTVGITDVSGAKALKVDVVQTSGAGGGTSSTVGAAVPSVATAAGVSDGTNMVLPRAFDGDSGAGSQFVLGVSLRKAASGGSAEAGTSADPLRVDPTGTTAQPVTDNGGTLSIDDGSGSITVDGSVTVVDGGGSITVDAVSLPLPTGASSLAEQQTQTTALQLIDDSVHAANAALSKVLAIGGQMDDTSTVVATENNISALRLDTNRALHVQLRSGATEAGTASVPVRVDPTGSTTQPVSGTVTANAGSGSFTVAQATAASLNARVQGADATDATVAGNPVLMGGRASTAIPGAVSADTDAVPLWTTRRGALIAQMVDSTGDSVMDDTNNAVRVNMIASSVGGGDGALLDGVSSAIKATVLDYVNSNPLAVRLSDTNGDYVGAGAGTQYVEDVAAATDPTGSMLIARRRDSLASEVNADGDNIALNSTSKGEIYVKHVDAVPITDNAGSITVDGTVAVTYGSGTFVVGDGGSSVSVDDNGGSLTVDGTVAVTQATAANLNAQAQGAAAHDAPVAGNPILNGAYASAAAPVAVSADGDAVNLWADRSGRLQVGDGGATLSIDDGAGTITVDNAALSVVGGGAEATALRVTIASDSTGVLSVDDNGSTISIDDGAGSITVDGAVTVSGTATVSQATATSLNTAAQGPDAHDAPIAGSPLLMGAKASAAAPADVSADNDVVRVWALRNGAQATVITAAGALVGGDATNGLDVDVTRVQGSVTVAQATASSLNAQAVGDVAHDGADAGNPVKVGAKAASALPTAVANNDRANAISDLFGRILTSHIDPAMAVHKNKTYTSTQTGTDVWTPASGKRIAVTSVVLGAYGTTAGRLILWFGDNADTTFTQDTDQVLVAASFAPSATAKPGLVYTPAVPVFCTTADRELHITTDAALSVDVTIEGYEY